MLLELRYRQTTNDRDIRRRERGNASLYVRVEGRAETWRMSLSERVCRAKSQNRRTPLGAGGADGETNASVYVNVNWRSCSSLRYHRCRSYGRRSKSMKGCRVRRPTLGQVTQGMTRLHYIFVDRGMGRSNEGEEGIYIECDFRVVVGVVSQEASSKKEGMML